MNQVPIKLGPVALLLTVISICLTVMAILTLSTAGADKTMAENFAASTQIRYTLETEGQKFLREADETLAAGGKLTDLPETAGYEGAPEGSVERIFEDQGYHLTIRLEPTGAAGAGAGADGTGTDGTAAGAAGTTGNAGAAGTTGAAGTADETASGQRPGYRVTAWSLEKTWEQNQEIQVWQP